MSWYRYNNQSYDKKMQQISAKRIRLDTTGWESDPLGIVQEILGQTTTPSVPVV